MSGELFGFSYIQFEYNSGQSKMCVIDNPAIYALLLFSFVHLKGCQVMYSKRKNFIVVYVDRKIRRV